MSAYIVDRIKGNYEVERDTEKAERIMTKVNAGVRVHSSKFSKSLLKSISTK